jgi:AraC-like DNA-binding protein
MLRRHRRSIENSYSTTDHVNLRWLLWLSGGAAAIWLLALVVHGADIAPLASSRRGDDLVSVAIALMVYAIGYKGLRQPEIFRYHGTVGLPVEEGLPSVTGPEPGPDRAEPERYERSGLGPTEASQLKTALLQLMIAERPYRDPELTLPALAERLHTSPHKLSEVLNAELSKTFYDFINGYRVDDVRQRLARPESKNFNLLTLALDAGFASKSTFNQVFKKQTGQTPSTYRSSVAGQ